MEIVIKFRIVIYEYEIIKNLKVDVNVKSPFWRE